MVISEVPVVGKQPQKLHSKGIVASSDSKEILVSVYDATVLD